MSKWPHCICLFNVRKTKDPADVEKSRCADRDDDKKNTSATLQKGHLGNISTGFRFLDHAQVIKKKLSLFFLTYFLKIRKRNIGNILLCTTTRLSPFLPKSIFKVVVAHVLVYKTVSDTQSFLGCLSDRLLVLLSIKNADCIFAVSASTANDLASFFPQHASKIKVIHLASKLASKNNNITEEKILNLINYILSAGIIEPRKKYLLAPKPTAGFPHRSQINFGWLLLPETAGETSI